MDMLFELYQQGQINEAKEAASKAQTKADRYANDIEVLTRKLERLTLASQALWELLRDSGFCAEEVLVKKMEEIDLRDGVQDGKISRTIKVCNHCGRNSNSKRLECVYCGEKLSSPNIFDAQ